MKTTHRALSFRDPIHGFIRADPLETELISSQPMQRLRFIRQLGVTHLVFPGAEHTRFSHALGAMHLAGRVFDGLLEQPDGPFRDLDHNSLRRIVRAAALLHDVGHAPFSHTAEELFDEPIDHEGMTLRLLATPEVEEIFDRHSVDRQAVERLLTGRAAAQERVLAQIVSGELDVDKMDYLLRDSLFCGVRYGQFDLERILDTVTAVHDPKTGEWGLGIDEGGVHAFEALVLARYYMFTQVYFNVTGKILELHFNQWLRGDGLRWPARAADFLRHDDVTALGLMRKSASQHARAVLARTHFKLVAETREHATSDEKERFEARIGPLVAAFGTEGVLISRSAKDPHRLSRSRVLVRRAPDELEPMEEASQFMRHLSRIDRIRVYARADLAPAVKSDLSGL